MSQDLSNNHVDGRPVPWLSSFAVGDDRIDGEHRDLIDAANDLCAQARCQADLRMIRGTARELIAIVEAHFANEEALFPAIGYTGMLTHVRDHLTILDALKTLLLHDDSQDVAVAAATARLLLVEHIIRDDLAFKTWVQVARGH